MRSPDDIGPERDPEFDSSIVPEILPQYLAPGHDFDLPDIDIERREPSGWPWLAVGLTLVVGGAYVVAQTVVAVVYVVIEMRRNPNIDLNALQTNGTLLTIATWAGTIVAVPLTFLAGWIMGRGWVMPRGAMADYLGLRRTSVRTIVAWTAGVIAFALFADGLTWLLGKDIVPGHMRDVYTTTDWVPALWLALVVAAPLSEELLFRGLFFRGVVDTPLGFIGAALITSACWAGLHLQYEAHAIAIIFFGGLLLATARYQTNSVWPCVAMHAAMNLLAAIETAIAVIRDF